MVVVSRGLRGPQAPRELLQSDTMPVEAWAMHTMHADAIGVTECDLSGLARSGIAFTEQGIFYLSAQGEG
jgi:hypothetical protein